MSWSATIMTTSGDHIVVDKLLYINKMVISFESSTVKIEDFKGFQLPKSNQLTFVGEKDVVAISSTEIKYIQFSED